jgi:hypothetical protein
MSEILKRHSFLMEGVTLNPISQLSPMVGAQQQCMCFSVFVKNFIIKACQ